MLGDALGEEEGCLLGLLGDVLGKVERCFLGLLLGLLEGCTPGDALGEVA